MEPTYIELYLIYINTHISKHFVALIICVQWLQMILYFHLKKKHFKVKIES